MVKLSELKGSVIKPGLETVTKLLDRLGNPQLEYKSIHIAGTNGKGSCAAMLREMLIRAGYRTAMYSSPHLHRFNERVTLDHDEISDSDIARLEEVVSEAAEGIEPTYFEFTTAMAYLYFAEKLPDVAIVEVGLGGRLDATNLVDSLVTVITPISMDHQEFLGNDLTSVSREKAGIMKPGIKAVVSRQQSEAMSVIESRSSEIGAPIVIEGREFHSDDANYPFFDFYGRFMRLEGLRCGLMGRHQVQNSAMALATVEVLIENGFDIPDKALRDGVTLVKWPGRLELLDGDPPILLDGTHNPGGAEVLTRTIEEEFPGRKVRLIFGMQVTKDLDTFLSILEPIIEVVHAVPLRDMEYYAPGEIAAAARRLGIKSLAHETVEEALDSAAGSGDMVLVTGSLYLVGEARELPGGVG